MKSRVKIAVAVALALGSSSALALQLGEIRVKSALDEPLVAEIPIQLDNLSEAKELHVGLASPADFAKAGLARNGLDHLRFSIVTDTTGHKLVLVTSEQPIGDPYLDFLIEVDSSNGKQLREYTVLLDPVIGAPPPEPGAPVAAPTQPAPVQNPAPQAAPPPPPPAAQPSPPPPPTPTQPQPQPQPAPAPPSAPPPSATPAAATHASEYTVQRGDTLYRIASENRPDDDVSIDQMMLALQSSNPDAFYKDNINNLKSGAILRIPTRDEIGSAPSGARAHAKVHRQNEDWRGAAAGKATTVAGNQAPPQQASNGDQTSGDKLALVPPTQSGGSAATRAGEKGGTGTEEVAGLKQQLATARESLASAKQENSELQSRVKDLEDIGNKNQKLLGMKDAQIADLQAKLAQMQKGAAAGASSAPMPAHAASVASSQPAAAGTVAPAHAASVAASAAPTTAASTASISTSPATAASGAPAAHPTATTTPVKTPVPHVAPAREEPMPWYQRPITWVIAGVAIVLLLLLGLMRRKPRPLPEPLQEPDAPSLADHFGDSPLPAQPAPETHVADEVREPVAPIVSHDALAEDLVPETPEVVEPHTDVIQPQDDYGIAFDEPPVEETVAPVVHVEEEPFDVQATPAIEPTADAIEPVEAQSGFSDDPVDTKLDLARAYLDMGDPAGARAMLEEVLNEGSQTQKDEAKRLLEGGA